MNKTEMTCPVAIERGRIYEKQEDAISGWVYKVQSVTRDEIISRWMEPVSAYATQWKGEPPYIDRYEYNIDDEVNYFMFSDGRGMILGKIRRDLE